MKFALAIGLLFSMSAFANDGFDCRSGQSPHGGKFCHYVISQCLNDNYDAAARCAIEKYSSNVTWNDVKIIDAFLMDVSQEELTIIHYKVKSNKGPQTQIVTLEYGEDGFLPVAIEVK